MNKKIENKTDEILYTLYEKAQKDIEEFKKNPEVELKNIQNYLQINIMKVKLNKINFILDQIFMNEWAEAKNKKTKEDLFISPREREIIIHKETLEEKLDSIFINGNNQDEIKKINNLIYFIDNTLNRIKTMKISILLERKTELIIDQKIKYKERVLFIFIGFIIPLLINIFSIIQINKSDKPWDLFWILFSISLFLFILLWITFFIHKKINK